MQKSFKTSESRLKKMFCTKCKQMVIYEVWQGGKKKCTKCGKIA